MHVVKKEVTLRTSTMSAKAPADSRWSCSCSPGSDAGQGSTQACFHHSFPRFTCCIAPTFNPIQECTGKTTVWRFQLIVVSLLFILCFAIGLWGHSLEIDT